MFDNVKRLFPNKEKAKDQQKNPTVFDIAEALAKKECALRSTYNVTYWKPKPGEELAGTVLDMGITASSHGSGEQEYLKISVDGASGYITNNQKCEQPALIEEEQTPPPEKKESSVYVVFVTSVLARQLEEESVQPGDKVAIRYLGVRRSQNGREYKNYILINTKNIVREVIE